jgi:putative Mg2+ transporter-C (MgtC) family protein
MVTQAEIIYRLLIGTLIGGIIGYERQIHGRPAGFRTHILVCISSVLLMLVSEYYHYLSALNPEYLRVDPGRIAAGAMTGVGFIGAGVVLKTGVTIQGLTTAACIWVVSAIGLSIGSGLYLAGILTFFITIVTLSLLRGAERKMPKLSSRFLTITADENANEEEITLLIAEAGLYVTNLDYEKSSEDRTAVFYFTVNFHNKGQLRPLLDKLLSLGFVKKVSLKSRGDKQNDI